MAISASDFTCICHHNIYALVKLNKNDTYTVLKYCRKTHTYTLIPMCGYYKDIRTAEAIYRRLLDNASQNM